MGVYIPNIKMPIECEECFFYSELRCMALGNHPIMPRLNERPSYCPLIEVKTPHGRLIDADELMKYELQATLFPEGRGKNIDIWTHAVAIGDVIGAETIIDAED